MKKIFETDDRLANSIRSLWHIESMEEKKKIIDDTYKLSVIFILAKEQPELFSKEELEEINKYKSEMSEDHKKIISEVFTAKELGFITDPPEYTVEEVKDLYEKGLYFTKDEIEEILEWQYYCEPSKHDPLLVILLAEYLEKHKYFDSIEEADKGMEEYENKNIKMSYKEASNHLTSLDGDSLPLSSDSTSISPSTISFS